MPRRSYTGPLAEIFDKQGKLKKETMLQLYETGLSAMRLVDRDLVVVTQNPAMDHLTGMPGSVAAGKKCWEVARARDCCHTDRCPHKQIMAGKSRVEQSYECELWNGKDFPAWVLATPFYDSNRQVAGSLQVVRDETHFAAFSKAIEEKNAELERLLHRALGYNHIARVLNVETRIENLAGQTLNLLPHFTAVLMAALYLYNESTDRLVPLATHALSGPAPEFALGQGLPGQVALTEEAVFLSDLPAAYFTLRSGVGEIAPAHVACLPIKTGDRFLGVIEVASLTPLDDDRQFLTDVAGQLGIALHNALMLRRTEELAHELQAKNEKLGQQNEELTAQSEELIAQSEEIQSQAEELIAQRDALEQKTMEADEANRMKSVFLSNMSHELRTPLNAILGLTRLMRDEVAGSLTSQQEQYLDVVLRNGNSLLDLINDILDLARVEAGREELRFDQIPLRGFLESLAASIRALAERQGLTFALEIAPEVSAMVTDERKLSQILTNLLGNAIKFTEKGGVTLGVSLQPAETRDKVIFLVQDTGIGIPADQREAVFEPFRQTSGSATRKHGGTGLGLSITKRLVSLLGGEISFESVPGEGTTFTLALPRDRRGKNRLPDGEWQEKLRRMLAPGLKPQGQPHISFPAPEAAGEPGGDAATTPNRTVTGEVAGQPHILLVEDDMIAVRELGVYLRELGYRVSFTLDGKAGLAFLDKELPDLLLLDLKMPEMDGFAFLEAMRNVPRLTDIPVLILSAMDLPPATARQLPANVRGSLPKGNISREQLLSHVQAVLGPAPSSSASRRPPPTEPLPVPATEVASGSKGKPRPGGRKILVAEDNPDNLFFLGQVLTAAGYEVMSAHNGTEALRIAPDFTPDLVLLDIQMPRMGGMETVKALRDLPALRDIPVLALTARAMKGDKQQILAAGFDGYISKPVAPNTLLTALADWLGGQN